MHVVEHRHQPRFVGLRGVVVSESSNCWYVATSRAPQKRRRRKNRTRVSVQQKEMDEGIIISGQATKVNQPPQKAEDGRDAGNEGGDKEGSGCLTPTVKSLLVERLVKADCVLAIIVETSSDNSSMGLFAGQASVKQEKMREIDVMGINIEEETEKVTNVVATLDRFRRALVRDIFLPTQSAEIGDREINPSRQSVVCFLHGEKCLPFCKQAKV